MTAKRAEKQMIKTAEDLRNDEAVVVKCLEKRTVSELEGRVYTHHRTFFQFRTPSPFKDFDELAG